MPLTEQSLSSDSCSIPKATQGTVHFEVDEESIPTNPYQVSEQCDSDNEDVLDTIVKNKMERDINKRNIVLMKHRIIKS